jgi:hypothetical protein
MLGWLMLTKPAGGHYSAILRVVSVSELLAGGPLNGLAAEFAGDWVLDALGSHEFLL